MSYLTEPQKKAALELRALKVPTIEIAQTIGVRRSDLIHLFMDIDFRNLNRKITSADPGIYDVEALTNAQEEQQKAARLWQERMGSESWRGRRKGKG